MDLTLLCLSIKVFEFEFSVSVSLSLSHTHTHTHTHTHRVSMYDFAEGLPAIIAVRKGLKLTELSRSVDLVRSKLTADPHWSGHGGGTSCRSLIFWRAR